LLTLRSDVPEIDLDSTPGTSEQFRAMTRRTGEAGPAHPLLDLLPQRPDLRGLPARGAADCQLSPADAKVTRGLSRPLRAVRAVAHQMGDEKLRTLTEELRAVIADAPRAHPHRGSPRGGRLGQGVVDGGDADAGRHAALLEQILQAEGQAQRLYLVVALRANSAPAATAALARRAVFDPSEEIRRAALEALRRRPAEEARPALLAGLRHLWPPAADHAAEALAYLQDRGAVPDLVRLLDQPDPRAPARDERGKWIRPELVRVNHLRNCFLCHAPSAGTGDPVRGLVPEPGQPIREQYYDDTRGTFVRADVTYLRQDFSVSQPVANARPWPEQQRYDYLVRSREVTDEEAAEWRRRPPPCPQREAVLFAIRQLKGVD
jgi:hypothetical protein